MEALIRGTVERHRRCRVQAIEGVPGHSTEAAVIHMNAVIV